jgi:hypothetical protein
MGACKIFLFPFGPSNLALPLESDLTVCETLSPGICVSSIPGFLDVELPLDEVILEAMVMDPRPLPEL